MYNVVADAPRYFEFKIGDREYKATAASSMTLDQAKAYAEVAKGGEVELAAWVIDNLFPEEARDDLHALTLSQIANLIREYIAESKVAPGESQA